MATLEAQIWSKIWAASCIANWMQKGSVIQPPWLPIKWILGSIKNGSKVTTVILMAGRCEGSHPPVWKLCTAEGPTETAMGSLIKHTHQWTIWNDTNGHMWTLPNHWSRKEVCTGSCWLLYKVARMPGNSRPRSKNSSLLLRGIHKPPWHTSSTTNWSRKNFESQVISEVCKLLHIDKKCTTAYHPQCNGQVDRFNRTLANMLAMYVSKNQKDWDLWLEQVLLAYRTSIHESTGTTPFPYYMEGKPDFQLTCVLRLRPKRKVLPATITMPPNIRTDWPHPSSLHRKSYSFHKRDMQRNMIRKHGDPHSKKVTESGYLTPVHLIHSLPSWWVTGLGPSQ